MSRVCDVFYFLCQIFFPHWTEREESAEPTWLQKILAALFLFLTSRDGAGTVFSIILHAFILAVLALIMISQPVSTEGINVLVGWHIPGDEPGAFIAPPGNDANDNGREHVQDTAITETVESVQNDQTISSDPAPAAVGFTDTEHRKVQMTGGFVPGGGFDNRTPGGRRGTMGGGGGGATPGSEAAVERALAWLAYHQDKVDGGWSLDFEDSCKVCSHSGRPSNRRTAATALALLAFLGAGYSHQTDHPKYRDVVEDGLEFLRFNPNGGYDGGAIQQDVLQMYSRGLAAMALCEAYAMSREQDPASRLGIAAQRSLYILERTQDPDYGGWNYRPDQTERKEDEQMVRIGGDTSIFAWQLMALKSGKLGGLHVSQSTLYAAQDFLDLVAIDGGRQYYYIQTGGWDKDRFDSPKTCTAIGLLMRMYLGWKPGDPILDDGMEQLAQWGYILREGECNLYYIYYATLALHHYGGEHWDSWFGKLQEMLIQTQSINGCEAGSWYFPDSYCDTGGRLLNTALGAMILETPYRFMPLYREIR
jgi:hypothetical protein